MPLAKCRTPREMVATLREFLKQQGFDVSRTELHGLVLAFIEQKKAGLTAFALATVPTDDLLELEDWLSKNLPAPAPKKPYHEPARKNLLPLYPDEPE